MITRDFDGDGNLDLAFDEGDGLAVVLGDGDGTFGQRTTYPIEVRGTVQVTAGDFNGDGTLDLATVHGYSNTRVAVLLGNGDGTFGEPIEYPYDGDLQLPEGITSADFEGDGDPDIATAHHNTKNVTVFLNNRR